VLLGFCTAVLLMLLLVQGVTTHTVGTSSTGTGGPGNALAPGSGPLLTARSSRLTPLGGPPANHRIALTFDDGPSSEWTPKVLAVLEHYHVPATFFLVGSNVARYPDLVRREHRDGDQLGNHTFTHAPLEGIAGWNRGLQIDLTQSAIAGTTGVRPRLLRPPYSSTPDALTPQQAAALVPLARQGYLITLADIDTEDWTRPGTDQIVTNATDHPGPGGIVLMHDAGGDRSESAAALGQIIPRLAHEGYTFVRVSDIAGLPPSAVELPAGWGQRLRGHAFTSALHVSRLITGLLTGALVVVAILVALRALVLLALAARHVRGLRRQPPPSDGLTPPVSIVVPAFNEAVGIARGVRSLAASAYPRFEIIVVDDGSTDETAAQVEQLGLDRVRIVSQTNAGKSAALNHGIDLAHHDVVVTVDADTVFEPEALGRLVAPFRDPRVGAVSGNTKIGNRRGLLGRWQHIEYVMGFNLDRRAYDVLGCMPCVPGAIGAFRRPALEEIGGVSQATLAEDADVTMALGRRGWSVVYAEHARAWTEAPSDLRGLWRQRSRWAYGTLQAIYKHRRALLRGGPERRIGRRALPYLIVYQVVLPLLAPVIDLFAVYGLLFLDPLMVLAYWAAFNGLLLVQALYAFRLDGERTRVLWVLPLQQIVYRQLMYLVVIEALVGAALGTRQSWRHLERTGDIEVRGTAAARG